jgi:hypothetical protein
MTATASQKIRTPRLDPPLRTLDDLFRPRPCKPRLLLCERRFHQFAIEHEGHEHSFPSSMLIGGQSRQTIPAVDKFFNG